MSQARFGWALFLTASFFVVTTIVLLICTVSAQDRAGSAKATLANEEALAAALIEARTQQEQTALLESQKPLVTAALARALQRKGDELTGRGNFPQAMTAFQIAISVAEQLDAKAELATVLSSTSTSEV